jgi:hypothetical protein
MDDRQQSTPWKVALLWSLSGGAVALLSSDAHQSQNADNLPKIKNHNSSKTPPSRSMWLKMETKPVWGTLQLLIFPFYHPKREIDTLLLRFGLQQVAGFVCPPWIFRLLGGVGVGATIRWGTIDVDIEPRGAESRSILPRYVSKNGNAWECDVPIMWNPLHSHISRSKIKTSTFSSTSPFRCHFRQRYMNLPPTIDHRPSIRQEYTYSESLKHPSGYWVRNWPKLCGIAILGGQTSSFWKVKITFMREDRGNSRPIIVAVHHLRSGIIWDGTMTKSYTVFLQILVIRWVPEYFMEVGAGIWANDYSECQ